MSKIKYKVKSGNASIDLDGRALDMFHELVDLVAPDTKRALEDYVTRLHTHARRNWLVRANKSKRSIDKFYTVFYVSPDFRITAGVGNRAPYAFAIKVGKKSDSKVPEGKNLAVEVLWKPAQRRLDRLIDLVADELINSAQRA